MYDLGDFRTKYQIELDKKAAAEAKNKSHACDLGDSFSAPLHSIGAHTVFRRGEATYKISENTRDTLNSLQELFKGNDSVSIFFLNKELDAPLFIRRIDGNEEAITKLNNLTGLPKPATASYLTHDLQTLEYALESSKAAPRAKSFAEKYAGNNHKSGAFLKI